MGPLRENPLGSDGSHPVFGVDRLSPPRKWPHRWRWTLGHLSEADTPSSQNWGNAARILQGGLLKAGLIIRIPRLAYLGILPGYPEPQGLMKSNMDSKMSPLSKGGEREWLKALTHSVAQCRRLTRRLRLWSDQPPRRAPKWPPLCATLWSVLWCLCGPLPIQQHSEVCIAIA